MVEYRPLSGKFLADTILEEFMYKATLHALGAWFYDYRLPSADDVQRCINTGNANLATQLVNDYKLV